MTVIEQLERLETVKYALAAASAKDKDLALSKMADALEARLSEILEANEKDLSAAEGKISGVMMDRLRLTKERVQAMAKGIRDIARLSDPVGEMLEERVLESGLRLQKIRVPMGVIAVIYESRPNVTSDAAALALKAGSAVILRSGKEAHKSAEAIVNTMKAGLKDSAIPEDALFLVEDTSRASSEELMKARGYVDLLIPRGGAGLIKACVDNADVPVLETGTGVCHLFVDDSADFSMALSVIENAKCSRPSVCNALESLLIHRDVLKDFLPFLIETLVGKRRKEGLPPVRLHLSEEALSAVPDGLLDTYGDYLLPAAEGDFSREFLDYDLAVSAVPDVQAAIDHVNRHSTGHSDGILSNSEAHILQFQRAVDSACVYANASTRFTDGGEFGFGCEIGISTQKLHARGPVGLKELCSTKYILSGTGQIRV